MAKKMRDKIKCFADTFNYNTNAPPQSISKTELMESPLFLDSMPNEFSISSSYEDFKSLVELYEKFRRFINSSNQLTMELEPCLFAFFCYIYIKSKTEENQELIEYLKTDLIQTIPANFSDTANEIIENEESFNRYYKIFSTQKYICKCSDETRLSLNHFLNRPGNSQLRSVITELIILERLESHTPDFSSTFQLSKTENKPFNFLNILKTEIGGATLATGSVSSGHIYFIRDESQVFHLDFSGHLSRQIFVHPTTVTTISSSSTSSVLFTGDLSGTAKLWSESCSVVLPQSTTSVWSSDFAPSGGFFAFGTKDAIIRLFDTPRHKPVRYLIGHTSDVTDVKFHHNCFLIASCATDSSVRIWDPREAKSVRLWIAKSSFASAPTFSWDGKLIAFCENNNVVVGDIASSGELINRKVAGNSDILSVHFSRDDNYLYVIHRNGKVFYLNVNDDKNENCEGLVEDVKSVPVFASMNSSNDLLIVTSKS